MRRNRLWVVSNRALFPHSFGWRGPSRAMKVLDRTGFDMFHVYPIEGWQKPGNWSRLTFSHEDAPASSGLLSVLQGLLYYSSQNLVNLDASYYVVQDEVHPLSIGLLWNLPHLDFSPGVPMCLNLNTLLTLVGGSFEDARYELLGDRTRYESTRLVRVEITRADIRTGFLRAPYKNTIGKLLRTAGAVFPTTPILVETPWFLSASAIENVRSCVEFCTVAGDDGV